MIWRQGVVTSSWSPVRLGDLVEVKHGFAFQGQFFRDEPTDDILLTPGNFEIGGGFKGDKFKYYAGPCPAEFVLAEGDLLVTMTDLSKQGDTLGYPATVPRAKGQRFLHNQRLGKIVFRDNRVDKGFLYRVLCTAPYRHEVLASATGSTVRHTSPSKIGAFKFLLPPFPEQKAIARVLGVLDDKIELNRRMNETLEAMARAIFKSWFVDFDPVREKAAGRRPAGMDDATATLFPDSYEDSPLGEIPRGWRVAPIGDLVRVVGGSTPSTKNPAFWEGGTIHFATPKDLAALTAPFLLDTERCITDLALCEIPSGLLPAGTVLLSSRAPIGYLAITEIPVAVNQGFIAMVCGGDLPNAYVLHWTRNNLDTIIGNANGSTFLEISKQNFRPILAVVPAKKSLEAFVRAVGPIHQRIVSNLIESRTLAAIRDALLPKLTSGEVRVLRT